jgi:Flp pilus assembly protein TadD
MSQIWRLRSLLEQGNIERYLAETAALAAAEPGNVEVRVEAAYACDRYGTEEDACVHYDAAWKLGVPDPERRKFMLGYGSTLRNVGRLDDSVAILAQATNDFPDYPALRAFLALSLQSAGEHRAAVATLLGVVLDLAAGTDSLDGYDRALTYYHHEMLEEAVPGRR